MHLAKQPPLPDLIRVVEIRRRRIGVFGGTVTDDQKGALRLWRDGHGGKLARLRRNARTQLRVFIRRNPIPCQHEIFGVFKWKSAANWDWNPHGEELGSPGCLEA